MGCSAVPFWLGELLVQVSRCMSMRLSSRVEWREKDGASLLRAMKEAWNGGWVAIYEEMQRHDADTLPCRTTNRTRNPCSVHHAVCTMQMRSPARCYTHGSSNP